MGSRLEAVRPSGLPLLNHIPGRYAAKFAQFFPAAVIPARNANVGRRWYPFALDPR
jgi:hypothetical protein